MILSGGASKCEMYRTAISEVSYRVHLKFFTQKKGVKFVSGGAEA